MMLIKLSEKIDRAIRELGPDVSSYQLAHLELETTKLILINEIVLELKALTKASSFVVGGD